MRFCDKCRNVCFLRIGTAAGQEPDTLSHYCRNCGVEFAFEGGDGCVLDTYTKSESTRYQQSINPYTHLDPTLPRTRLVPCPNPECESHHGVEPEVVYLRYDQAALAYVYLCSHCQTAWRTDDNP